MAPRVNTAAVKAAQKRFADAAAAGRTYEEQLEYEVSHGVNIPMVGFILMVVGFVGLLLSLIQNATTRHRLTD